MPKDLTTSAKHYFSTNPSSKLIERKLEVVIRGKTFKILSANGVFSGKKLDIGTEVLFRYAPEPPPTGNFLDLGCGWGPISLALASASPSAQIWAIDINERARFLTTQNAKENQLTNLAVLSPSELENKAQTFDLIWSNPPVRIGKSALQTLTQKWLNCLKPTGQAVLVMNKNLGADSYTNWLRENGWKVSKIGSAKGFRVLCVTSK